MKGIKRLALAIVLFSALTPSLAASEIVYSGRLDLNGPDLRIDINNDGSNDFIAGWRNWAVGNGISWDGFDAQMVPNMQLINTEFVDVGGYSSGFPGVKAPLDYGEVIGPTPPQGLLWNGWSNEPMMWTNTDMWNNPMSVYSGAWHRVNNKYLGFAMSVGSDVFYGWMRLDTDFSNNIRLVDYAYENVLGTPIMAGAGGADIVALDVAPDPAGSGTITSDPPDINCPEVCQDSFDPGTPISLTATPEAGWVFDYWDDGLNQYFDPTITVSMDSEKNLAAHFKPSPVVGITINGSNGPLVARRGSPLSLAVWFDRGAMVGELADCWIYMDTPWGPYSYVKARGVHEIWLWVPGIRPYGQLSPQDFETKIFKRIFRKGNYVFHFAVDSNADGVFDGTWTASVEVTVTR